MYETPQGFATGKGSNSVSKLGASTSQESLASIAPRVIQLAHQLTVYAAKINESFGIDLPESAQGPAPDAPTLMSQLLEVERHLRFTAYALEGALQHING